METFQCGQCNEDTQVGYWCSPRCFTEWQQDRADKPPVFSAPVTVFYTGPMPPHDMAWLTKTVG